MHPCHVFCCHVWVLYHVHLIAFSWLLAVNRRPVPFTNRNSDSGVLYIVFKRVHLIFSVAYLHFHLEARFIHSLSNHALASHTASRISYHVCIMLFEHCTWWTVFLFACCYFLGRAGRRVRERGAHCLRGSRQLWELCRQDDHTLEITSIFAC